MKHWRWTLRFVGGPYDGVTADSREDPAEVLIVWRCASDPRCIGHVTHDPNFEFIELRTAESYRRVSRDDESRVAVYEHGEMTGPEVSEFETVTTGIGSVESDPYDPRAW